MVALSLSPKRRPGAPAAGDAGPRPAIWAALRNGCTLTVDEAAGIGRCDRSSARSFLRGLLAGGIVDEISADPLAVRLAEGLDPGPAVPRLRQDGTPVEMGRDRQKIWKAVRILKTFDLVILCATAEVSRENAETYVHYLVKGGYLSISYDHSTRRPAVYSAVQSAYTGPIAPQITRIRCVWDPNIGRVAWPVDDGADVDDGGDA